MLIYKGLPQGALAPSTPGAPAPSTPVGLPPGAPAPSTPVGLMILFFFSYNQLKKKHYNTNFLQKEKEAEALPGLKGREPLGLKGREPLVGAPYRSAYTSLYGLRSSNQ